YTDQWVCRILMPQLVVGDREKEHPWGEPRLGRTVTAECSEDASIQNVGTQLRDKLRRNDVFRDAVPHVKQTTHATALHQITFYHEIGYMVLIVGFIYFNPSDSLSPTATEISDVHV